MADRFLDDNLQKQVREFLSEMKEPVVILFFGSQEKCELCSETERLLGEVVNLSDKLSIEVYDLEVDAELAQKYHVDMAPGFVLAALNNGEIEDYGVRYAGIPAGHEFSALINDLLRISSRDSGLSPETRKYLSGLTKPVHLQVYVTPT